MPDPRHRDEESDRDRGERMTFATRSPSKVKVRVVLRQDHARWRVIVEVEDGADAVGDIAWYRLDFGRSEDPVKNLADARAAYEVIEGIVATLYDRSRGLETQLKTAETKVKQLEGKIQSQLFRPKAAPPPQIDPLMNVKRTVAKLMNLASSESTTNEERLSAHAQAHALMRKHGLLPDVLET